MHFASMWSCMRTLHATSFTTSLWMVPVYFVLHCKAPSARRCWAVGASPTVPDKTPHQTHVLHFLCFAWLSRHQGTSGGGTNCWDCWNKVETIDPLRVPLCLSVTRWGAGLEVDKSGHHGVVHLHQNELPGEQLLTVSDLFHPTLFSWKPKILCFSHPPLQLHLCKFNFSFTSSPEAFFFFFCLESLLLLQTSVICHIWKLVYWIYRCMTLVWWVKAGDVFCVLILRLHKLFFCTNTKSLGNSTLIPTV